MMPIIVMLLFALQLGDTRHAATVKAFEKLTGYPNGRPGYVVDHRIPLCAGGPDTIDNLQWQEIKASYVKDDFERKLCAAMKAQHLTMVKTG